MASRALTATRPTSLDAMLATIPSLPRPVLSRLVARMIDHLDALDPDPDLEPEQDMCLAGDDGLNLRYDQFGKAMWGSELYGVLPTPPIYGEDQRAGPTNYADAHRQQRAVEAGLERSPTGGWRVLT